MAENQSNAGPAQEGAAAPGCCPEEPQPSCCCGPAPQREGKGFLLGLVYGLVPHTFCILFIVLSVVGATAATSVIKQFLYNPYLFQIIVALSFVFATLSAAFYLKRNRLLSLAGARLRWKYLSILYGTTVGINLLFFMVIFPIAANADFGRPYAAIAAAQGAGQSTGAVTLQVSIPCPGHAPLIMDELRQLPGITGIRYQFPSSFQVTYDTSTLSVEKILALDVFREFRATVR